MPGLPLVNGTVGHQFGPEIEDILVSRVFADHVDRFHGSTPRTLAQGAVQVSVFSRETIRNAGEKETAHGADLLTVVTQS